MSAVSFHTVDQTQSHRSSTDRRAAEPNAQRTLQRSLTVAIEGTRGTRGITATPQEYRTSDSATLALSANSTVYAQPLRTARCSAVSPSYLNATFGSARALTSKRISLGIAASPAERGGFGRRVRLGTT